jgi:hypothetical protein
MLGAVLGARLAAETHLPRLGTRRRLVLDSLEASPAGGALRASTRPGLIPTEDGQ